MFAVRALTAVALLAALGAAVLWLERGAFAALLGAVVALAAQEWAKLAGLNSRTSYAYAGSCALLYGAIAWALHPLRLDQAPLLLIQMLAALFWTLAVPLSLAHGVVLRSRTLLLVAGLLVVLPAALAMAALPAMVLFALLGLVWIADTAAYLAGRAFGRRKLAPSISPGKTWEGAAGALAACLIYAAVLVLFTPSFAAVVKGPWMWLAYLAATCILTALSIVGDLYESALKRGAGVKDSGKLLPGHGGVLDRIDSATAVLPAGVLLISMAGFT